MKNLKRWIPSIICVLFIGGLWFYMEISQKIFQDKLNELCSSGKFTSPPKGSKVVSKIVYYHVVNDCDLYVANADDGEMYSVSESDLNALKVDQIVR